MILQLLPSGRQSRRGHDLSRQLTDVEIVCREESSQVGQLLGAERTDRLLDQVVEQLLDKSGMRFPARGQIRRQVPNPIEFHQLTRAGLVGSCHVDRLPLLLVSISTEGVEMLQGKSKGVDHAVA